MAYNILKLLLSASASFVSWEPLICIWIQYCFSRCVSIFTYLHCILSTIRISGYPVDLSQSVIIISILNYSASSEAQILLQRHYWDIYEDVEWHWTPLLISPYHRNYHFTVSISFLSTIHSLPSSMKESHCTDAMAHCFP